MATSCILPLDKPRFPTAGQGDDQTIKHRICYDDEKDNGYDIVRIKDLESDNVMICYGSVGRL